MIDAPYDVLKFGGSCLSSGEDFSNAVKIVSRYRNPVVIVSAISGITQRLIDLCGTMDGADMMVRIQEIQATHLNVMSKITKRGAREPSIEELRKLVQELIAIATDLKLRDSPERNTLIMSYGERLSAVIMKGYLLSHNLGAQAILSNEIIVAEDENLLEATVDVNWSRELIRRCVSIQKNEGNIPVITGFFCRTPSGKTAILGRNSSDYTAAVVSSSLNGSCLTFWKDVPGLMTGDPKFVKESKVLSQIGYEDAEEYIRNGARILHSKVISLSRENGIPIKIRDFRNPDTPGTIIGSPADFERDSSQIP